MGASPPEEYEEEDNFVTGRINTAQLVQAMSNLARSTDDRESLLLIYSSIHVDQEEPRETTKVKDQCQSSTRKRSHKATAGGGEGSKRPRGTREDTHIKGKSKGKRLVQIVPFECDACERQFATEAALKNHKDKCTLASNAPKSTKYKCFLCNKERPDIYNHYVTVHCIKYPEQIMFGTGNALVHSDVDTRGGKAPWFLKAKYEAIEKYDDLTCRLCESAKKFHNSCILRDHYLLHHMVEPDMLCKVKELFRARKGAHLGESSAAGPRGERGGAFPARPPAALLHSKHDEEPNIRWPCNYCDGTFSTKSNLSVHVKRFHSGKKPENVSTVKADLTDDRREQMPNKSQCMFCEKELIHIYKHYGNKHNIEYPEQLLFDNGIVLVLSDIDTQGGTAPWFLREVAKLNRYTATTCRLCDTVFDDTAELKHHYRLAHKLVASAFKYLPRLFRAAKGAHLTDMPTSGAASKRHNNLHPAGSVSRGLNENPNIHASTAECEKRKSEELIAPKKFDNAPSESPLIEKPSNYKQPINVLQDLVVSGFCSQCNTSVTYANFEAHAAAHNKNNYVAENSQDNNGQTQLGSPGRGHEKSKEKATEGNRDGTAEPWLSDDDTCDNLRNSSYVLEVDVHAERGENIRRETTGQSDSGHNSKDNGHEMAADIETTVNAVSTPEDQTAGSSSAGTRHVQYIEGQEEEWDGMGNELMGDLKNLLGPAGTGADADKSSSDTRSTSHLIEETQRIKDIMFSRD